MSKIYLKEKIGKPELFTGRKQEMDYLLKWVGHIPRESSKSTALLSRRKTGKSALMQRLYNVLFENNGPVIPFYFEIKERSQWLGHFAERFFRTFIFQYLAFKMRQGTYVALEERGSLDQAFQIAEGANLTVVQEYIERAQDLMQAEQSDHLWELVREAPRFIAAHYDDYIVQMVDEFQFINRFIFRDKACKDCLSDLAGSYLHTAEYRNAPLLVSGSWVGWLMGDLMKMLPGRFKFRLLKPLPEDEALFRSDIIERPSATYQGVQDNIFDKVFRSEYGEDIDEFVAQGLRNEYKAMLEELQVKYNSLLGKYNRHKGLFAEFLIIQHLKLKVTQNNAEYRTMFHNLPPDFKFVSYESVLGYHSPPLHPVEFQIDVFARAKAGDYSLIGEVKHRHRKFSLSEAAEFVDKAQSLLLLEPVTPYVLFVFSSAGFELEALDYFQDEGLAWSEDARWLL